MNIKYSEFENCSTEVFAVVKWFQKDGLGASYNILDIKKVDKVF
jgi:hypothetical protein